MKFSAGLSVALAVVVSGTALIMNPPKATVFELRTLELQFLNQRRSFYRPLVFGKILENRPSVYLSHYLENISYGLDINYYFFASHPRERAGFSEGQHIPALLLPLFLIGLVYQLAKKRFAPSIYFLTSLGIISFFTPFDTYALILYPYFVVTSFIWLIQ